MLPREDREAINLLGSSLLSVVVISGLTLPALYFGGDALLSSSGRRALPPISFWFHRLSSPAEFSSR